jgi:tRNA/tmRNA/rRNA uracil-C5-methylase (TrmA/RlmC/RlmD family)
MSPYLVTLTCTGPANGGTVVARHDNRVVFVRHAAPGETVTARVLDPRPDARFWHAEAIEVLEASPDRVPSVWPEAGPDGIGGADYAFIALPAQRRIKTEVLVDLLTRARVDPELVAEVGVEPAPHDPDGLRWRTRAQFAVAGGRAGMRGWRSHDVLDVGDNPLVTEDIHRLGIEHVAYPSDVTRVDVMAPYGGTPLVVVSGENPHPELVPASWSGARVAWRTKRGIVPGTGPAEVDERVGDEVFRVSGTGFWQVHRGAAAELSRTVLAALRAEPGWTVWDLFAGAGLFTIQIARALGPTGTVRGVEGAARAVHDLEHNATRLEDAAPVTAAVSDVLEWVTGTDEAPDAVVLDPPRAGAGVALITELCARVKQRMVYVSCDAATLARDLAAAQKSGWRVVSLRALDLFPHTHHLECVAVLERA